MTPIEGVTYWWDPPTQTWHAIGRPDISMAPAGGAEYGGDTYGERPYGQ